MKKRGADNTRNSPLKQTVDSLLDKGYSIQDILQYLLRHVEHIEKTGKPHWTDKLMLPCSIFDNPSLSALETIVKYLHENKVFTFANIARMLNRDQRAINTTYRVAKKKMLLPLQILDSKYHIPVSVFTDRKFSVLEHIVSFLKKEYSLSYREIGKLLRRNERTVWTTYQRARTKEKGDFRK